MKGFGKKSNTPSWQARMGYYRLNAQQRSEKQERFEFREFPQVDVEPNPLFRPEPKPLFLLKEELPGSEKEGKLLFTPPFHEQVPRPEFELQLPLLQKLPADAGAIEISEETRIDAEIAANNLFFILFPFV